MRKNIEYDKIKEFKPMRASMNIEDAVKESSRCLLCEDAPCTKGCPAGTDPGKFIRQIRFVNYKGAARTVRNNNVMGAVCAFTCPVEKLCEKECSNKLLDDPINIAGLQRFACEYGEKFKLEPLDNVLKDKGRVAVIGAGPAGMSCAATLAKLGYAVTVFEKEDRIGGVPGWNIPKYRMPDEAISSAAAALKQLGVAVVCGKAVEGKDAAKRLLADGFKACFVSTGLSASANLDLLAGYENVSNAKDLLKAVKLGKSPAFAGKRVAVIGGGSVAMDAAVTAKALGAKKVCAISLEALDELPADEEEIELARRANVVFKSGSQLTNAIGDGKRVVALKGVEIEWKEPGKFIPSNARPIEGTGFDLKVDHVIQAIGSVASSEVKEMAGGLEYKGRGTIAAREDLSTDVSGLFAGGDIANGGATIAKAVGDGKKAAESMHKFISKGGK